MSKASGSRTNSSRKGTDGSEHLIESSASSQRMATAASAESDTDERGTCLRKIDSLEQLLKTLKSTRFTVVLIVLQAVQWALTSELYVMAAYLAPPGNSLGGNFTTIQNEWPELPLIFSIDASEFVSTATFLGSLSLGFLPGVMSDRFGRKMVITCSLMSIAFFGFASALAPSFTFLLVFRYMQGFFLNSIATVNFVHCMESVADSRRYMAACAFGLSWCIGYTMLAPISLVVHSWRWMIATHSTLAFIISTLVAFLVPESPAYSVSQNNRFKLKSFVRRAQKLNGVKYDVDYDAILADDPLNKENQNSSARAAATISGSLCFIVHNPRILLLLAVVAYTEVATLFAYTGLSIAATSLDVGSSNWNFVLSGIVEIPAYCGVPKLCDSFGTKYVMLTSFTFASISLIVLKFIGQSIPLLFVAVWLVCKCFVTACYYASLIISTELFPTKCRSFAVAFALTLSNIGAIFGPHSGALNVYLPNLSFLLFGTALGIAALFIAIFIPGNQKMAA